MVAALYVRRDSIYKAMEVDCYDVDRDARTYAGPHPVVAHPPCRAWGQLAHMAKPRPDEKALAVDAVKKVRAFGGVLEHPRASRLWLEQELPRPGERDEYGGFSICINQSWFGHKCEKSTLLYIVGVEPRAIPAYPISLDAPTHVIGTSGRRADGSRTRIKKEVTKKEREATPPAFAAWLVKLAEMCANKH